MGAEFQTYEVKVLTHQELRKEYQALKEEAQYEYGHGGYTGTLAEDSGLEITTKQFTSDSTAEDWLIENARKWGPTLAVRVTDNDTEYWVLGGWYSS